MKILLIEDDEEKSRILSDFVCGEFLGVELETARSFSSGLRAVINGAESYSVILLDMSMPNYDVSPDEPGGGTPESFAGIDLLAQMQLRGIHTPTIVVTMFDKFGDEPNRLSLKQLIEKLDAQYRPIFRGLTYYNVAEDGWRSSLKKLIEGIVTTR